MTGTGVIRTFLGDAPVAASAGYIVEVESISQAAIS